VFVQHQGHMWSLPGIAIHHGCGNVFQQHLDDLSDDMGPWALRVCWFSATNLLIKTAVSVGSSTLTVTAMMFGSGFIGNNSITDCCRHACLRPARTRLRIDHGQLQSRDGVD
jgi:hypothetical protein